jgi:diguanylate cyclase (GGDEF)-like protein
MFTPLFPHATTDGHSKPSLAQLAQTNLFREVPESILLEIQNANSIFELKEGHILLSPEHDNQHVFVLLSGSLSVHFGDVDMPESRLLEAGACVGEMSIIDQIRPSAYVVAREDCQIFPVHSRFLQRFVTDADPMVRNLLKILTQWIRENTECMVDSSSKIGELTNHAATDPLTGLFNRRWLDDALAHFLVDALETAQPLCVLLLDVDHFKSYNDTYGHSAGDHALKVISNTLKHAIRPQDFACRYGGEEFLVLLPHTTIQEGSMVAERIRHAIEEKSIIAVDGEALPKLTISVGLAVSKTDSTPKSLIDSADAKLYQAKQEGRNCVRS